MSDRADDEAKVGAYLRVVQERILAPIQDTDVRGCCTATLLLLFAAMDGLGHLLRPRHSRRSTDRIAFFLQDRMGGEYALHVRELLDLRKGLVHHAVNVASYLSAAEEHGDQHLTSTGDFMYVNTLSVFRDFNRAFERSRTELQRDPALVRRAAERLEWREIEDAPAAGDLGPRPTPPPPVVFIRGT